MRRLEKKLAHWEKAGLIDPLQRQAIEAFESSSSRPVVLWAAGGLGAFAIVIGIVSIVAANWLFIPAFFKLAAALSLCVVLAFTILRVDGKARDDIREGKMPESRLLWLHDILILLYYGVVLASMALVGQVYQLDGSIAGLLVLWTVVSSPFVFLARGNFVAPLWTFMTGMTYFLSVIECYEWLVRTTSHGKEFAETVSITLLLLGPLLFIYFARASWIVTQRPLFSKHISLCAWLVLLVGGFFAHLLWYSANVAEELSRVVILITGIAVLLTLVLMPKLYAAESPPHLFVMRMVMSGAYLSFALACWHSMELPLIGALANIAYLCLLAWAALKFGSKSAFNLVTAVLALRILVIYFEVFGSLCHGNILHEPDCVFKWGVSFKAHKVRRPCNCLFVAEIRAELA